MIIKAPALVTAEELLDMPNSVDYELVDGILVERQMGAESNAIAVEINYSKVSHSPGAITQVQRYDRATCLAGGIVSINACHMAVDN